VEDTKQRGRKSGIGILGEVPWGSHFCLFYETEEDLIDILVPYFKAGLENNEFCMWVTSDALTEEEANDALIKAIPDYNRYLKRKQIQIIAHDQWYLKNGVFDLKRVLNAWIEKLDQALSAGFEGMRVTGDAAWLEAKDWRNFAEYEVEINMAIDQYRMIVVCSYCVDKLGASEIIDVVDSHRFALIRQEGKWRVIESGEHKKAVEKLQTSETRYRTLLESLPQKIFLKDKNLFYIFCNENYAADLKIKAEEIAGKTDYDFYPKDLADKYRADDREVMKSGETEDINEKYIREGKEVIVHTVKTPVRDKEGNITGVLGIFWDITSQRRAQKKLLDYQKRLRDLTSEVSLTEEHHRRRVAVELHDMVTQNLILFKINLGEFLAKKLPLELAEPLNGIYEQLDQIIRNMRSLTFDLGSPTLYELGLEAAIREYLDEEIQRKHGLKTEFEGDTNPKPLDDDVRAVLYRSVRELLINVIKHAQAKQVKVSIRKDNDNICVNVIDDGVGFKSPAEGFGTGKTAGFGLFSIRERLSYLGGSIDIESKHGEGTGVTLVAPLKCAKSGKIDSIGDYYEHKNFSG